MDKIKSILVMLMLLASTGIVSASTTEIVKTQYPAFIAQFGIGEVLYKITDNGQVSYQVSRNGLIPLSIESIVPSVITINVGQSQSWKYKIIGCCSVLDGNNEHQHKMILYDTTGDTIAMNSGDIFTIADGTSKDITSGIKTFTTPGIFNFKIKEFIRLWSATSQEWIWASGNSIYLTVQVEGSQPTDTTPPPTQTTPPPTGACADGTANLACSSQKPMYCYYGTLINKASTCGCPSGQLPSGDNCIAVTATATQTEPSACDNLEFALNGKCVQIIPALPGFEVIFAIVGLFITAYLVLTEDKRNNRKR